LVPDSAIVTADNSADMQVQGINEEETALIFAASGLRTFLQVTLSNVRWRCSMALSCAMDRWHDAAFTRRSNNVTRRGGRITLS